jgi:hypothetical protein
MARHQPCFAGEATAVRRRRGGSAVRIFVAATALCTCKPKEPSPPSTTSTAPPSALPAAPSTLPAAPLTLPAAQSKLTARFRGLALDGYVAYLKILAQDEDGSDVAWALLLARFTDECLGDEAGPTILLDLDSSGSARPIGVIHPRSILTYPAGESMPSYEDRLTRASGIEISGGEPPKTADGIGHGEKIGNVTFDIHVRDGSISGETVLVDCGR